MSETTLLVQVLVNASWLEECLTYSIPEDLTVRVGDILSVPINNVTTGAIAINFCDFDALPPHLKPSDIKPINGIIHSGLLNPDYWELLQKVALYYRTPLLQVLKTALPPKLLEHSHYRVRILKLESISELTSGFANETVALPAAAQRVWAYLGTNKNALTKHGISHRFLRQKVGSSYASGLKILRELGWVESFLEMPRRPQPKLVEVVTLVNAETDPALVELTSKQKEVILILQQMGGEMLKSELSKIAKTTNSTIPRLRTKGYIVTSHREVLRFGDKEHIIKPDQPKNLIPEQIAALNHIRSVTNTATTILLHGVTGSGKTEVYLQAITPILEEGKSVLVIVPEIGLTPQLTDRFRARFGDSKVNVYHSQLSDGERFDTWRWMLRDEAQIVIGTRSAIFAPLHNLGMIIIDEEHDSSLKQDQPQPCYHARTVAQWRSQMAQVPLLLGSATPSAEAFYGVTQNQIDYLTLPNRVHQQPMPVIEVVDMRLEINRGNRSMFSQALQQAIRELMEQQQQGILFMHRRGHSTFVSCRSCGYVVYCPHCDVSLSYHLHSSGYTSERHKPESAPHLRCHYCNYGQVQPRQCPECGSPYFKQFGSGTQKVQEELSKLFPELRVIRFDSDTTSNKDQHRNLIEKFRSGAADVLIGTQMLTKGLDIPQVTLVGIVAADGLLHFADYRANERALQTLLQVAGRSGRGTQTGRVILQTYTPDHAVIEAVQRYELLEFMEEELAMREAMTYPPYGAMALIHLSSLNAELVTHRANYLADYLRQSLNQEVWQILGAAPATIPKVADRYRWQILLKFPLSCYEQLPTLNRLKELVNHSQVRLGINVDPITIL
ncbi:MAG: primosomal protein N' [Pseudanabaenaceae cyanobacterium]